LVDVVACQPSNNPGAKAKHARSVGPLPAAYCIFLCEYDGLAC